jgi:hypothetical protein
MNHFFISHSHDDSDFAEILENRIKQENFLPWRDIGIRAGDDWRKEIDKAIKDSFALIVVMTPAAKASEYVTYEWAFAWGEGVKVIPILLEKTELHPRLESLQYLDFTNRNARPWDRLIDLLGEADVSKPQEEKAANPQQVKIEDKDRDAYYRMIGTLNEVDWTWRSIESLAIRAGISEDEALTILRRDANVKFGKGKSGRRIARLIER